jgi:hypothetical protein
MKRLKESMNYISKKMGSRIFLRFCSILWEKTSRHRKTAANVSVAEKRVLSETILLGFEGGEGW